MAQPRMGPIRIGPKRRVVLPVEACRELGVDEGDELCVIVEDDTIKLMTREAVLKSLRDMFADYPGSPVDDLIAMRRDAAKRERQEIEQLARPYRERADRKAEDES
jgi:bifunctional DNA-binding transcriptional regulator/antitoxin component of YhaV-PrlF toxin-antitoxin module